MKKYLSAFLVFLIMLSQCFCTFADSKEFALLNELGVLPEGLELDEEISRGEFASIAARLYFDELSAPENEIPFLDVDYSMSCYNAVYNLKKMEIVSGNGIYFRPNDNIKPAEATALILKAIGYQQYADANGGYPTGYLYTAALSGITDNVSFEDGKLTAQNAIVMFYNSLFADSIVFNSIQSNEFKYSKSSENILSARLNIKSFDGILTDDGMMSFDNSGYKENNTVRLRLNSDNSELMFKSNNKNLSEFFGENVRIYAKYDDSSDMYNIISVNKTNKNEKIIVRANDIVNSTTSYVEYEDDENSPKTKKITFSTEGPYIFVNGYKYDTVSADILKPKDGFVEYIDNTGDKKTDVILVWEYTYSDVIDSVTEKQIMFKINPVHNMKLDDDKSFFRFSDSSGLTSSEKLNQNTVLSVCIPEYPINGENHYYLFANNVTASGTVEGIYNNESVLLNDKEYKYSNLADKDYLNANLRYGENVILYIDYTGNVIYLSSMTKSSNYLYIIDLYRNNSYDDEIKIKAYTANAVFENYVLSDNIQIDGQYLDGKLKDGTAASRYDEIRELLCVRPDGTIDYPTESKANAYGKKLTNVISRPVVFKLNSSKEITYLDTDAPTYDNPELEESDPYVLRAGIRYFKDSNYTERYKTFNGRFFIDTGTVILLVADIDRYGVPAGVNNNFLNLYERNISDLAYYNVLSSGEITKNESYDVQAYNIDPDTGIAGLVLLRGSVERAYTNNDYNSAINVFEKTTEYYDSVLKKKIYRIHYNSYGSKQIVKVDPEMLSDFCNNIIFGGTYPSADGSSIKIEPLHCGDAIYINSNNGYLTHLQRDLDITKINIKPVSAYHSVGAYNPYYTTSGSTNVTVPFDQRYLTQSIDYASTYIMDLAIPYSVSGNKLAIKKTAKPGGKAYLTLSEYIKSPGARELVTKYIDWSSAGITVVEEKKHNAAGGCEFIVRAGDISDIKFLSGYENEEEGFYNASRIFTYDEQGYVRGIIIYNLSEEHNHVD